MDYCACDHVVAEHRDGTGPCRGRDDDGEHCGCRTFETEPEYDIDGD